MGTQQIILIVLAVIIIGVSVAIGISIFANQAYSSNRQAVSAEVSNLAGIMFQFWKTPVSMGGAGSIIGNVTLAKAAAFLGFSPDEPHRKTTEIGEFRITAINGTVVTVVGLGLEIKNGEKPLITALIDLATGQFDTTVGSAAGFE